MNEMQIGTLALIKSGLYGSEEKISPNLNWQQIFKIGQRHQIIPLLYYGIVNSKANVPSDIKNNFYNATVSAVLTDQNQQSALKQIFNAFEENNISYLPLKGTVLKQFYAKPELRTMGDSDILIKAEEYNKIKDILKKFGFIEITESNHEFVWNKPKVLYLELHKKLIPSYNKDYYEYYKNEWAFAKPAQKSRFTLTNEDLFIYLFTHFSKHYRDGGIGLKHAIDLYVFYKAKPDLNKNYLKNELNKLNLFTFFKNVSDMLFCWFENKPLSELTDFLTDKIFKSGAYGTKSAHIVATEAKNAKFKNNKNNNGNKNKKSNKSIKFFKLLRVIFLPYGNMAQKYTILKKLPVLLPFMWVVRWVQTLILHPKNIKKQKNMLKIVTEENIKQYRKELEYVGLK